jgi:hypothetical protein
MNAIPNSWIGRGCLALLWFCLSLGCSGCAMYFPATEEDHQQAMREYTPSPKPLEGRYYLHGQDVFAEWSR